MGAQVALQVTLTEINCGECGATYAINERYRRQKEDKGGGWHCPYCQCRWGYFGKTEAQQLKEQLDAEQKRHRATLARLNETQAREQKLQKRVGNGVCPCCKRTFKQLARHMEHKHPHYVEND